MANPTPITEEMLSSFSQHYQADPVRKLATCALSKTDLADVAYAAAGKTPVPQKFSIDLETLPVTNEKERALLAVRFVKRPPREGREGEKPQKFRALPELRCLLG